MYNTDLSQKINIQKHFFSIDQLDIIYSLLNRDLTKLVFCILFMFVVVYIISYIYIYIWFDLRLGDKQYFNLNKTHIGISSR